MNGALPEPAQWRIRLCPPAQVGDELELLAEALAAGQFGPMGPHKAMFEAKLSALHQGALVMGTASGTAALHLALRVLDVGPGDVVLCPSLTYVATANAIRYVGAEPVFLDAIPDGYGLDPEALETALRLLDREGTPAKALLVTHLYGIPAALDEIMAVAQEWDLPVVEDAAEALGATWGGQAVGTFGRLGVLSFNANKVVTTGGGGALITRSQLLLERAHKLAHQALEPRPYYWHQQEGYNYALGNLNAAVGLAQLDDLERRVEHKRHVFDRYQEGLEWCDAIYTMPEPPGARASRWLSTVHVLPQVRQLVHPQWLRYALAAQGIETRQVWTPLHWMPRFRHHRFIGAGHAGEWFRSGLCLPSGPNLSFRDQMTVLDALCDLLHANLG